MIQAKEEEIKRRTLMSTERSLALLDETEQVGIATAEELARQREQLEKTSKQLDNINATLRFSQKHLNGLKSVFGGLKNYLAGGNKDYAPKTTTTSSGSPTETTSSSQPSSSVQRGGGAGGVGATSSSDHYDDHPVYRLRTDPTEGGGGQVLRGPNQFQARLDQNLDSMAGSLSRLKGLALDLHTEIDTQNVLLDNITNKTEDADIRIGKQNKDMHKLLGKK